MLNYIFFWFALLNFVFMAPLENNETTPNKIRHKIFAVQNCDGNLC